MYCESKFATVMLVNHLAKWSAADGIVAIAVDPGNIRSDLQRHDEGFWLKLLVSLVIFSSPEVSVAGDEYPSNASYCSLSSTARLISCGLEPLLKRRITTAGCVDNV